MTTQKKIRSSLISVYDKTGLEEVVSAMQQLGIKIFSTGGTFEFIKKMGIETVPVEDITLYPSILGGRVKTLHPKIFGGILGRRDHPKDIEEIKAYEIPEIDLVIVDLYPFEKTVASTGDESDIIEKIDIGGISLIRAAAKNHHDVVIIPSKDHYSELIEILRKKEGVTNLQERRYFATQAFNVSSHYDTAIFSYFNRTTNLPALKQSITKTNTLRYGENPHQQGIYFGDLELAFEQLHGKAISYNNINDLDAAVALIDDFSEPTFAIIKHNNACGLASRENLADAWQAALSADPVSAYGGVLVTNSVVDGNTATGINKLFFEIILAPDFQKEALDLLYSKKNRIILKRKPFSLPDKQFRTVLNGVVQQERDIKVESPEDLRVVTLKSPTQEEISDLLFANIVVKHTRSNAIVLVKNKQLIASGVGQTSRVDALKQAIEKAQSFGFDLQGAVMASDAFFPFADSVEIAHNAGIMAVIQPGGSVRDQDSVDYCNKHKVAMVFTGYRHFKH